MLAEIIETPCAQNNYSFRIHATDTDGIEHVHWLRGLGAPSGSHKVGDRGQLSYRSGPSFGLWCWGDVEK